MVAWWSRARQVMRPKGLSSCSPRMASTSFSVSVDFALRMAWASDIIDA